MVNFDAVELTMTSLSRFTLYPAMRALLCLDPSVTSFIFFGTGVGLP